VEEEYIKGKGPVSAYRRREKDGLREGYSKIVVRSNCLMHEDPEKESGGKGGGDHHTLAN